MSKLSKERSIAGVSRRLGTLNALPTLFIATAITTAQFWAPALGAPEIHLASSMHFSEETDGDSLISAFSNSAIATGETESLELRSRVLRTSNITQNGPSALMEFAEEARIGVTVYDLNTSRMLLEFNGDEKFTAASTYKLFTTYDILDGVDNGLRSLWEYIDYLTFEECIAETIEYSENDCIESWIDLTGNGQATSAALRSGAINTTFEPYDIQTTANDLSNFLISLYRGELLSSESTQRLLTHMRNQVWRDGIPHQLEPEATVFDKPGWLEGVRNDAAIIESPKGNFVFVVLTESDEFNLISEITKSLYDLL